MAIDWDQFDKDADQAIRNAGDRTDARLATAIAAATRLTDDEIQQLFPNPADAAKLKDLVKAVKAAGDRNDKINSIVANSEEFAGIVVKLVEKFA